MINSLLQRVGVCSWSLQPATPQDLFRGLKEIGLSHVIIALDPLRENPAWSDYSAEAGRAGVKSISGMFGTIGEDYTTLDSIRLTGGVVPDAHWEANWANIQTNAKIASALGLKLVMFHAGFLPHESSDPAHAKLIDRLGKIADLFAAYKIDVAFETGQEDAPTLIEFLNALNRPNVGVNFDPANMILYDKGDPIKAMEQLAPWIKQVHLKDANRTKTPGTWGEEVTLGTGQVPWKKFMETLTAQGFNGWLYYEREAGQQRVADIVAGHRHLLGL